MGDIHPGGDGHICPAAFQAEYMKAESMYCRSLAVVEATLGPDLPEGSGRLESLAVLLSWQVREYWVYSSMSRPFLSLRGGMRCPRLDLRPCLPRRLQRQGNHGEAESFFRRATAIVEATSGTAHPDYSRRLCGLVENLWRQVRSVSLDSSDCEGMNENTLAGARREVHLHPVLSRM